MRSLLTTVPVAIAGSIALSLGATPAAHADVKMRDGVREGQTPTTDAFGVVHGANAVAAAPAPRVEAAVRTAAVPTTHVVQPGDTITRIAIRAGLRTIDVLTWNKLSWSSTIYPGQVLRLTPGGAPAAAKPAAAASASTGGTYTVKAGDTVWGIANNHRTSVDAILRANGLSSAAVIYPGQKLKVGGGSPSVAAPAAAPAASTSVPTAKPAPIAAATGGTYTVKAGDTVWGIAQKHGTTVATLIKTNGLDSAATIFPGQKLRVSGSAPHVGSPAPAAVSAPAPASAPAKAVGGRTHEVKAGDTLWAIAQKHGVSVATVLKANGLSEGAIIYPGQKLKLSAPAPAPAVAAAQEDPRIQRSAVLDAQQIENARIIIQVGREIGASDRAIAIALATAMVESGIRNLNHGDRDSLGLFQQRPSAGWGTPEQIRDRVRSTRVFFGGAQNPNKGKTRGLYDIRGWEKMEFTDAAQAVQISAFPNRYGQWESAAFGWLAQLG